MEKSDSKNEKMAYSVNEISLQTSLSKAFLRNEIQIGNLKAKRVGRRVLVMSAALTEYLEGKADWKPKNFQHRKINEMKEKI